MSTNANWRRSLAAPAQSPIGGSGLLRDQDPHCRVEHQPCSAAHRQYHERRNSVSRLRRAVTTRGRLVIVGGEGTGGSAAFNGSCGATLLSPFVRQQLGTFVVKEHARYLLQLRLLERFEANPFGPLADLSLGVWLR